MILFGGNRKKIINYTISLNMSWYYLNGFTRLNRGINVKGKTIYEIPYNASDVYFKYESEELKPEDITLSDYNSWDWFNMDPGETAVANWALNSYYYIYVSQTYVSTFIPKTTVTINGETIQISLTCDETKKITSSQLTSITTDPSVAEFGPFNASGTGGTRVSITSVSGRQFRAAISYMDSYTIGLYFNDGNKCKHKLYR
ncbi:MAG: hypothetical protein LUG51_11470 [Tannerellaceae bacterium]|nr:hypothetical protein [Tannerellaceae bacterium]